MGEFLFILRVTTKHGQLGFILSESNVLRLLAMTEWCMCT